MPNLIAFRPSCMQKSETIRVKCIHALESSNGNIIMRKLFGANNATNSTFTRMQSL